MDSALSRQQLRFKTRSSFKRLHCSNGFKFNKHSWKDAWRIAESTPNYQIFTSSLPSAIKLHFVILVVAKFHYTQGLQKPEGGGRGASILKSIFFQYRTKSFNSKTQIRWFKKAYKKKLSKWFLEREFDKNISDLKLFKIDAGFRLFLTDPTLWLDQAHVDKSFLILINQ